jgi:outer membrane protein assembly factor BamB
MKKILSALLALLLLTTLVACGAPTSTTQLPTLTPAETAMTSIVAFSDPALESMVRTAMGKPSGDITVAEAKTVASLNLAFAEWQKYVSENEPIRSIAGLESFANLESLDLSGNAITDLAPLSALTNLKALILTGCAAEDYTPLASLTNLHVLILDHSTIADPTPLLALSNLNCLFLEGSQIRNYLPLADIRASLELADFDVAFTLAELGFTFNDNDKMALYETDKYDIRINHVEWGNPPQPDWQNCIRVVTVTESGYKNAIGFYPAHNAYVVWIFNPNTQEGYTYVYDVAANSFGCERASMEAIVREAFGDVDDKDVLLTPFVYFDNIIQEALGIPIDVLCNMPFDESIELQSKYTITTDSSEVTTDQSPQQPTVIRNGNTAANLFMRIDYITAGIIAQQEDLLYFGNLDDGNRLNAATRNSGKDLTRLLDGSVSTVNVFEDTIYFCYKEKNCSIYSIDIDGQNLIELVHDHCYDLSLSDGWLYYRTSLGIFKTPAGGGEPEWLLEEDTCCVYSWGGWVYYLVDNEGGGLWRISIEGGESQPLLTNHHAISYAIQDDLLYCLIDGGDSVDVIRMKLDGTEQEEVFSANEKIDAINISGNRLLIVEPSKDGGNNVILVWNLDKNIIENTIEDLSHPCVWCFDTDAYYLIGGSLVRHNLDTGEIVSITQ